MTEQLDQLEADAIAELTSAPTPEALEEFRRKYLGVSGRVRGVMRLLSTVEPSARVSLGARINEIRERLGDDYEQALTRPAGK